MSTAYQANATVSAFVSGVEITGRIPKLPLATSEHKGPFGQQVSQFLLQSRYTSEMDFSRRRR